MSNENNEKQEISDVAQRAAEALKQIKLYKEQERGIGEEQKKKEEEQRKKQIRDERMPFFIEAKEAITEMTMAKSVREFIAKSKAFIKDGPANIFYPEHKGDNKFKHLLWLYRDMQIKPAQEIFMGQTEAIDIVDIPPDVWEETRELLKQLTDPDKAIEILFEALDSREV